MSSEELYEVINCLSSSPGEKLSAWMCWCKAFDQRELEEAAAAKTCRGYHL